MALQFTTSYLEDSLAVFRQYKRLAEGAMEQLTDEQPCETIDPESNSVAIIVKHMAGNMRSRWTDFLTSDGEKPNRNPTLSSSLPLSAVRRADAGVEPLIETDLSRTGLPGAKRIP
jgi:hypothetical protein